MTWILLGERPGYAVDLERVMAAAKERGCFLEVNAHPAGSISMTLTAAPPRKSKVAISTDARSTMGLAGNALRSGPNPPWLAPLFQEPDAVKLVVEAVDCVELRIEPAWRP